MSRTTEEAKVKAAELVTSAYRTDLGICATCNHAPTCVNLKASSQPIWHCDQFDDYVPAANPGVAANPPVPRQQTGLPTNGGFEGLCRHCDARTTCVNRTAGVAVWHCEEYC